MDLSAEKISINFMLDGLIKTLTEIREKSVYWHEALDKSSSEMPQEVYRDLKEYAASNICEVDQYLKAFRDMDVEYTGDLEKIIELQNLLDKKSQEVREKKSELADKEKAMEEMNMKMEEMKSSLNMANDNLKIEKKQTRDAFKTTKSLQVELQRKDELLNERERLLAEKDKQLEALRQQLESEKEENRKMICTLTEQNTAVLKMVQENAKNLAFQKRLKDKDMPSPTYIKELDTKELIRDYSNNGYKLSNEIAEKYISKYGITYAGLRLRLVKAGVWRDRKEKKVGVV